MKVSSQEMENRQVSLNVEMEAAEVDKYLEEAYNHLVGRVKVPGFRKGKAPRSVLESHIGKAALLDEALEHLIPDVYQKALAEQKIEPIARPDIEIIQTEPIIFKAIVPVMPLIKLGDYKAIRVESKPVEVGEKETEEAIQQIRMRQVTLLPVDRPAQMGDAVTLDFEGECEGKAFPPEKGLAYKLVKESMLPLPGFAEKLEGIAKGEERAFVLAYPADYERQKLAGKEYNFKVKVGEIKEEKLPEINDDFAKALGVENLVSLKEKISAGLKTRADEMARYELEQKIIDAAVACSTVEYPPALAEIETDHLIEEEARNFDDGIKGLENYLKSINKTAKDHREELNQVANRRVVRSLVLEKISEEEKIEISAEEIDAEIEKMIKEADTQAEQVKQLFSMPQARKSIEQFLISRKTMDKMKQIAAVAA
jgi:trigger factor